MGMIYMQMAQEMQDAIGFSGALSKQLIGTAQGIVEEIQESAIATFGVIPGPHPTSGMSPNSMAQKIAIYTGYGYVTPQLIAFCKGIIMHMHEATVVTYKAPTGLLVPTENFKILGTASGTNGPGMAEKVRSCIGFPYVSPNLLAECTAISNHINANAQIQVGKFS